MSKRVPSDRTKADSDMPPTAPTSSPTIGNTHVVRCISVAVYVISFLSLVVLNIWVCNVYKVSDVVEVIVSMLLAVVYCQIAILKWGDWIEKLF